MSKEALDDALRIRVSKKDLAKFQRRSERVAKKPYQVLIRELISAFNDGKLRIIDNENNLSENFYVTE